MSKSALDTNEMLKETMVFLREQLDDYIRLRTNTDDEATAFIDGSSAEGSEFPLNVVTQLLVNVHQDRTNRVMPSGKFLNQRPEVDLNLYILFVCRYTDYSMALQSLSLVISFFQSTPTFTTDRNPTLDPAIGKLSVELSTMPFAEQNEVWNSLRRPYWPSALYKVRMLVYSDNSDLFEAPVVEKVVSTIEPRESHPTAQAPTPSPEPN